MPEQTGMAFLFQNEIMMTDKTEKTILAILHRAKIELTEQDLIKQVMQVSPTSKPALLMLTFASLHSQRLAIQRRHLPIGKTFGIEENHYKITAAGSDVAKGKAKPKSVKQQYATSRPRLSTWQRPSNSRS